MFPAIWSFKGRNFEANISWWRRLWNNWINYVQMLGKMIKTALLGGFFRQNQHVHWPRPTVLPAVGDYQQLSSMLLLLTLLKPIF